ncbi:hypothetical protein, partial [Pseudomonas sp. MPR-AND1A]|uniref:hypothetical protein n=2 Tax=Pseudomonadota TaxID=1224 RepID=UPI000C87EB29
ELCALADGRDTDTGRDADVADAAPTDRLGELGDALLAAYQLAEQDGDPLTVALLEQALLRTGRRLARGMSPADVGIA